MQCKCISWYRKQPTFLMKQKDAGRGAMAKQVRNTCSPGPTLSDKQRYKKRTHRQNKQTVCKTNLCQQVLSQACTYKTSCDLQTLKDQKWGKAEFSKHIHLHQIPLGWIPIKSCSIRGYYFIQRAGHLSRRHWFEAISLKGGCVTKSLVICHDCCEEYGAAWCANFPVCKTCVLSLLMYSWGWRPWRWNL